MKTFIRLSAIILLCSTLLFGCNGIQTDDPSKNDLPKNPLAGTLWSYDDVTSLGKEQYTRYIEFLDETNVRIWDTNNMSSNAVATGTYSISGSNVTFNGVWSKYWMKYYIRATFTSNTITAYYKYTAYNSSETWGSEFQEIYTKK